VCRQAADRRLRVDVPQTPASGVVAVGADHALISPADLGTGVDAVAMLADMKVGLSRLRSSQTSSAVPSAASNTKTVADDALLLDAERVVEVADKGHEGRSLFGRRAVRRTPALPES